MRWLRILLKIALALLVIVVIGLLISLKSVDSTPYFESDYYQSTMKRLADNANDINLSKGAVSVGFSKINITPVADAKVDFSTDAIPMAGYGDREGKPAKGVHDSLYVKAIAVQVEEQLLVILAADLLIIPPNIAAGVNEILTQRSPLNRDQIFFSATHTHSSIGAWSSNFVGEAFAGEPNPEVVQWLIERMASAVEIALADLKPGQIGNGSFEAPALVRNRLVGEQGQEHATCSFLVAQQHQGKKALIGIFDAHATTLSGKNYEFSADYPAYFYKKLNQAGIDFPVFCAGSVGSHGPESQGETFGKAQYLGETLADSVLKYSTLVTLRDTLSLATLNLKMDLPPFQVRVSDGWRLAPFLVKKLFPPIGEVYVQSARMNDFILTTTPADFSGELAIVHQNALYKKGFDSAITSFNGAYIGYVLPAKYYHLNEYESRVMSWFGPNMGPYLDELVFRMTDYLVEVE